MRHTRRRGGDLFDHARPQALACGLEAEQLSRRLRLLSEDAHRASMPRTAVLIEIAARVVEMEGRSPDAEDAAGPIIGPGSDRR